MTTKPEFADTMTDDDRKHAESIAANVAARYEAERGLAPTPRRRRVRDPLAILAAGGGKLIAPARFVR